MLTMGSLFDGIAGFPLATSRHGIKSMWASEIEPFPVRVSQAHFPDMKQLGSVTDINGAEVERVDIITFGSPCQDLSVAGKREGLDGERSHLFFEAVRIINEMRKRTLRMYPTFAIWENVPGALSSNRGRDFRAVLEALTEAEIPMPPSGRWAESGMVRGNGREVAWRCLDAQYWGVPQRRKRIFLVVDFGGDCASEILFEPEGLCGNIAEGRKTREEVAAGAGDGVEGAGESILFEPRSQDGCLRVHGGGISPTLNTMQGGQRQPCVAQPTCAIRTAQTSSNGWGLTEELSYTLDLASGQAVIQPIAFNGRQDPVYGAVTGALDTDRATQCVAIQHSIIGRKDEAGAQGPGFRDDGKMFTLDSRGSAHAVAQCVTTGTGRRYDPETEALIIAGFKQGNSAKAGSIGYEVEKSPTLTAGQSGTNLVPAIVYPDPAATLRARGKTKNSNPAGQPLDNLALIPVLADQGGSQMSVSYNLAPTLRAQEHGHQPLVCSKTAPTLPAREKGGGGLGTDFDCDGGLVMAFGVRNSPKPNIGTDIMPTLLSNENAGPNQYVCGTFQNTGQGWWNEGDKAATLRTPAGGDSVKANLVSVGYAVRRLTPLECERLQGLQDGWTNIPGASDTARYRAIGNGLAIPCPEWIFKRINEVLYSDIQMAL